MTRKGVPNTKLKGRRLLVCRSERHWMEGTNLGIKMVKRKQLDGSIIMVEERRCLACDNERQRFNYKRKGGGRVSRRRAPVPQTINSSLAWGTFYIMDPRETDGWYKPL